MKKIKKLIAASIAVSITLCLLFTAFVAYGAANISAASRGDKVNQAALEGLPDCLTPDIVSAAIACSRIYKVPASVTLAQVLQESGLNFSALAVNDHNLFGVKFAGSGGVEGVDYSVYETTEYGSGGEYTVKARFKRYKSFRESIDDHGKLLASPLYMQRVSDISSPDAWAHALTGLYATDPGYGASLIRLMNTYNLYRFDGLNALSHNGDIHGSEQGTEVQQKIAAAALSSTDPYNNGYHGMCESWVCDTYRKAGLSYKPCCCASRARDTFARTDGDIPVGAVIYSAKEYRAGVRCSCGRDAGHVAIYIGGGKVAGSQTPFIMSLDEWTALCGYGGWSFNVNDIS